MVYILENKQAFTFLQNTFLKVFENTAGRPHSIPEEGHAFPFRG
jgi:hypothetical protein